MVCGIDETREFCSKCPVQYFCFNACILLKKTFFSIAQCLITCYLFCSTDVEDDPFTVKVLRHVELIDDEASEYGIKIVKCSDRLMAKKYGFRNPPGVTYFRKGKYINYDGKTNLLILRALEKGFI